MANLRSLIVKIGADTQSIDKALATVGESAKTIDAGLKKLGNTPLGKQAQQDADRLAKSLQAVRDGQERVASAAALTARGIEAMGGPARLTRQQIEQLSKELQNGLQAFRALGQQAPAELQKVAAAVQKQSTLLKQQATGGLFGQAGNLLGGLGISPSLLTGVGAVTAVTGAFVEGTRAALTYADSLTKLSDRTGIGVVALQRLEAVAKPSGNSIEDVANAVNQFQRRIASDAPAAAAALSRIGLSIDELRGLSPDDQFFAIARGIQSIKDPADQTRIAMELFGRSGAELLPTLKANVDELADSTAKLSAETVRVLDEAGDAWDRFLQDTKVAAAQTVVFLTEGLRRQREAIEQFERDRQNRDFVGPVQHPEPVKLVAAPLVIDAAEAVAETDKILGKAQDQLRKAVAASDAILEQHRKQLEAVNQKIAEAERPFQALSAVQQELVIRYRAFGLANNEIALKLGVSTRRVDAFVKELDALKQKLKELESGGGLTRPLIGFENIDPAKELKPFFDLMDRIEAIQSGTLKPMIDPALLTGPIEGLPIIKPDVPEKLKQTKKGLDEIAQALSRLAQISNGTFGGIVRELARVVAAADLARDSIASIKDAGSGFDGLLNKIGGGIGIAVAAIDIGKAITDAFHKSEAEKIAEGLGRDLGLRISDGLAQELEASSQAHGGSRDAATLLNLDKIIGEAGGLESFGFERAVSKLHDLFSVLERGEVTVGEVGQAFDRVFSQLIPAAIDKATGLASAAFVELQQTALRFDIQSPALDDFRRGQISNVNTGLNQFLGTGNDAFKAVADAQKRIAELQSQLANASAEEQARIRSEIAKTTAEMEKQQGVLSATQITSQVVATGVSGSILVAFGELQRQGVPLVEIFKQLSPTIDAFQQQLDRTGFSGGEAFERIRSLSQLASDQIAGPALQSVSGLQQVLAGLANTGGLDQEIFSGLTQQVGKTFQSLVDQGKDGDEILRLMAPTLQTIYELQQRTGFAVDETTQNMLSQAGAQGLIGEQFKSTGQQTVDVLKSIDGVLRAVATAFGVALPQAAQQAATGVNNALDNIAIPDGAQDTAGELGDSLKDVASGGADAAQAFDRIREQLQLDLPGATVVFDDALQGLGDQLTTDLPNDASKSVDQINAELRGIDEPHVVIRVDWDIPPFPGVPGEVPPAVATGGLVTQQGIQRFRDGGRALPFPAARTVQYRAQGGPIVRFIPRGTDTVPAMLRDGHLVLNVTQQARVQAALKTIDPAVTLTGGDAWRVPATSSVPIGGGDVPAMLTPHEIVMGPQSQSRIDRLFAQAGLPSLTQIAFNRASVSTTNTNTRAQGGPIYRTLGGPVLQWITRAMHGGDTSSSIDGASSSTSNLWQHIIGGDRILAPTYRADGGSIIRNSDARIAYHGDTAYLVQGGSATSHVSTLLNQLTDGRSFSWPVYRANGGPIDRRTVYGGESLTNRWRTDGRSFPVYHATGDIIDRRAVSRVSSVYGGDTQYYAQAGSVSTSNLSTIDLLHMTDCRAFPIYRAQGGSIVNTGPTVQHFAAGGSVLLSERVQPFAVGGTVLPFAIRAQSLAPSDIVLDAAGQGRLAAELTAGGITVGTIQVSVAANGGDDPQAIAEKVVVALRTNARAYEAVRTIAKRAVA